ncbi:hypothetical protein HPB52_005843 [Rhipicephalus sanguineus]|uniref:Uncharacterized protein n=1 Tax=Rhipicephalus sanguineus TaxID=34632 RepID=A0A9D4SYA2_RHISA|nr:hypothetical protein HPB52_005843 [Rhipicephalus sanguineus]
MADGADRTAPVNPEADCLGNASKNICKRAFFTRFAAAASVALIAVLVFLGAYAGQTRGKQPSDTKRRSFCCPDDVEEISRYLNTSAEPCDDFFAYVCSNTMDSTHSETEASLDFRIQRAAVTGTIPNNARAFTAGRFLNSFYKTCLEAISQRESFASSLASAFLKEAGYLLENTDSRKAMTFNAEASLVYSLHSVIRVQYRMNRAVTLEIAANCDPDARYLDDLNATVDVLKRVTNSTATTEDTVKLAGWLCEQFQGEQGQAIAYHLSLDASEFSQEVWNLDDVVDAMKALGFALKDSTLLNVRGVREIRLLYDIFFNDTHRDVKAAYLLWHIVSSGVEEFSVSEGQFSPQAYETCSDSAFSLRELWELFKAEIFTTPDKDAVAENIFAQIADTVHKQFKEMPLVEAEDIAEREIFFENVRLLTPMAQSRASVPVPNATQDFTQNLLRGRRFNIDVYAALLSQLAAGSAARYRDLFFLGGRYILLSPSVYDFIRTASPNSLLPNMAILGQLLAESLWGMALSYANWKPKTKTNIFNFGTCFIERYLDNANISHKYQVLYTSLGMSTVVRALNWSDWHVMHTAWSLWRLSHAQFFYIFNSRYRCSNNPSVRTYLEIKVPLMYVQDFAEAFSCPRNTSMKARGCLDPVQISN